MIKQAEKAYAPLEVERQVREFWSRAKVYEKTVASRSKGEDFYFGDGPPFTTGRIHLGLVLNKTVKDAVIRYRRMHGFHVRDQPGYDMHGLPIEVQVEKTLGITNKKEIEDLGIGTFVDTCRTFALDLLNKMTDQSKTLGIWMDWDRPYMTIRNEYIEGAWWTLSRAHERGLMYEALRSTQWCSRDETALADAEIEYSDEKDPSIYVKFPLIDRPDESLLIWTTTPWTLPANLAIAVHPQFVYAKVRVTRDGTMEFLWALESSVPALMVLGGVTGYEIVERRTGEALVGWTYRHPLASKVPYQGTVAGDWVHRVVASEIVEAEHTGLVHSAPGHGPEDFELGQRLGLPVFSPVDERGRFTAEAGAYRDTRVKEADPLIVEDLRAANALFAAETLVHAYGHCWRCRTPILYRATVQWFLKVTDLKPRMIEEVRRVAWYPDWAGHARQMDWTQNLRDWCISRQRYWGIPLPIWRCRSCGHWIVVGTAEALRKGSGYKDGMDLHRPHIDTVLLPCPKCKDEMRRVPDTVDVWFDSGVASWASLGYPAREDEFRRWWPQDWIVEGPDQTRGWFNSQLAAGVIAFDRAPYDHVVMNGWVNGPDGRAMHKSLGNVIEPETVVEKYGVDPLRLYVLSVNAPWDDITFQEEGVRTAQRSLTILWNVLRFATTYMGLDRFDPMAHPFATLLDALRPEDQWLLSRLEGLKATVATEFETVNLHRAYRAVDSFILDDLSRWYVKLVRNRTWIEAAAREKLAAYHVLFEALRTLSLLLAPATPFLAEAVYQRLDGRKLSVHMVDWPLPQEERRRPGLEASMAIVRDLVEVVSKERQKGGRKLRWPMKLVALQGPTPEAAVALEALRQIFLEQANAKNLVVLKPQEEFPGMALVVRPDAAAIGKAYRVLQPKIVKVLESRSAEELAKALEKGSFTVGVGGQTVTVEPSMVRFEKTVPAEVVRVPTPYGELYLDLHVTPDLQSEAYAREIIRRVQQMRKDLDLEVDDFIVTLVKADRSLAPMLEDQRELIARETRSRKLTVTEGPAESEYVVEWNDVDGHTVTIGVTPLHMSEALREFTQVPNITIPKALALFDAGYKSLAAVRAATKQELAQIGGLDVADGVRILDALASKKESPATCPTCGASVSRSATRCPRCGEAITTASSASGPSRAVCVACGEWIPAGSEACPSCGAPQSLAAEGRSSAAKEETTPRLQNSSSYLVKEATPDEVYNLFQTAQRSGKRGMVITRVFPQKIRERFGVAELPILWLSNVGKEDTVRPKDLEKLSLAVEQFLARERGVVLLDAIEYLVTNNNFITVLRLVQSIRDQVAIHGAVLLLSLNPASLDPHQMTLLEREVDEVIEGSTSPSAD
jgi:isoleucyl-tRNA synthetase